MTERDLFDPKGLVREAYAIPGITEGECRSIFLDWALSLPPDADPVPAARVLLERHAQDRHPMSDVLRAALGGGPGPHRRGGRAGRLR